ncbi:MAG: flavin reductase family protein, partial [Jatrophihabitans sp.]
MGDNDGVDVRRPILSGPDADSFRHVLGHYPTGVAGITAMTDEGPLGMAMNSFTSLSLHPPLVLFCPAESSTTWPRLRAAGAIAINVLSAGQQSISRAFALRDSDRFGGVSWSRGGKNDPTPDKTPSWLEWSM